LKRIKTLQQEETYDGVLKEVRGWERTTCNLADDEFCIEGQDGNQVDCVQDREEEAITAVTGE
jgi:hypothetical protein